MQLNHGSPSKRPAPAAQSTETPGSMHNTQPRTVGPAPSVPTLLFGIPLRSFDQRPPESRGSKTNTPGAGRSENTSRTRVVIPIDLPAVTQTSASIATSNTRPSSRSLNPSHSVVSRKPNVATSRSVRGAQPTTKLSLHTVSEDHAPPRGTRPPSRHNLKTGEAFISTPSFWPLSLCRHLPHKFPPLFSRYTSARPFYERPWSTPS